MDNAPHKPITDGNASLASPSCIAPPVDIAGRRDAEPASKQALIGLRKERIRDYLELKLGSTMPEVSLLAGVNSDLAALALQLKASLDDVLEECEDAREYLATVPLGAEILLKLARQIDRQSRLIGELEAGQAAVGRSKRKRAEHRDCERSEETRI